MFRFGPLGRNSTLVWSRSSQQVVFRLHFSGFVGCHEILDAQLLGFCLEQKRNQALKKFFTSHFTIASLFTKTRSAKTHYIQYTSPDCESCMLHDIITGHQQECHSTFNCISGIEIGTLAIACHTAHAHHIFVHSFSIHPSIFLFKHTLAPSEMHPK